LQDITSSGDIFAIAGVNITVTGSATIQTMGGGDITLVVDNLFPTAPGIGSGLFDIPDLTLTSAGEIQLYAGALSLSIFPASINGTAYTPGAGVNEQGDTYYPNGIGGTPFKVFFKTSSPLPPPSPSGPTDEQLNKGRFRYFAAMSEAFMRWTPYSIQGIGGFRTYAPMSTGQDYFFPYSLMQYMRGDQLIFEKGVGVPQRRFLRPPSWKRFRKSK
jgi:hypothetical protein